VEAVVAQVQFGLLLIPMAVLLVTVHPLAQPLQLLVVGAVEEILVEP
jgi:hypothetical protein